MDTRVRTKTKTQPKAKCRLCSTLYDPTPQTPKGYCSVTHQDLHSIAGRSGKIVAAQCCWLDDNRKQSDWLAVWGRHDEAHRAAIEFEKAVRSFMGLPRHWRQGHMLAVAEDWDAVYKRLLKAKPSGLVNQIIDGAMLRAGLVVGAVVKCGTLSCEGRIDAGMTACPDCHTHIDLAGVRRCLGVCRKPLEANEAVKTSVCKECVKRGGAVVGMKEPVKAEACRHYRVRVTDGGKSKVCVQCEVGLA